MAVVGQRPVLQLVLLVGKVLTVAQGNDQAGTAEAGDNGGGEQNKMTAELADDHMPAGDRIGQEQQQRE